MSINKIKCKICGKEFAGYKGLSVHIIHTHKNTTKKEYYDNFLKSKGEGLCRVCGKPTKFINISQGYFQLCSNKCVGMDVITKNKRKETTLRNYGVENPSQSYEVLTKKKETFIKNYGVDNPMKNKDIQEKIKKTNLKKYGAENPFASEQVQEKIRQVNLERYGVENPSQSQEIQQRIRHNNLERYGVEHIFQKHIKNYENWLNLEEFLMNHDKIYTCLDLCSYFNVNYKWLRKIVKEKNVDNYIKGFSSLSTLEQIFAQELDKLNIEYELHNRKVIAPLEVDFYLPKYKIAIEVSPAFTHQYIGEKLSNESLYGVLDQDYHYNKFKLCKEQGIELITVFDWTDQERVLSFIKSKTLATETIYARKTTTKLVQGLTKEHKDFLERNHILGSINNSKTTEVVELHYDNEIIGLAVFEQKKNYTELRRLAFESGYRVQGGTSKLIKTFTREHAELKEVITFSDNDLGTGNVYKQLGFQTLEENKGTLIWYNYKYDKKIPNLSLVKQGTDRLLKNFPDYEYVGQGEDLPSNQEIVQQYGFVPVYDCGYTKWVLTL